MKKEVVARVIAMATAGTSLLQSIPCNALELDKVYSMDEAIYLSGQADEKMDTLVLQIYKDEINEDAINSKKAFEKLITADAKGVFSESIKFGDFLPGGKYTVRVLGKGGSVTSEVSYANKTEVEGVLAKLNKANTLTDFSDIMEENVSVLGIEEQYEQRTALYNEYLFNHKPSGGYTFSVFQEYCQHIEMIYELKNTDTELLKLVGKYEAFLDAETVKKLKAADETVVANLRNALKENSYKDKTLNVVLKEELLLIKLSSCERYTQMQSIMEDELPGLGYDLSSYNSLKDKSSVFKKMYESKSQLAKYEDIEDVFKNAVSACKKSENIPTSTSTGGSGGGGGWVYNDKNAGIMQTPEPTAAPSQPGASETTQTGKFSDIDEHWAKEEIEELCNSDIVSGYSDGTFKPDNLVTRAEFTKLIVNAFNIQQSGDGVTFEDVSQDAWYAEYVAAASSCGLITGDDNRFRPDETITRQDAAVILYRTIQYMGIEVDNAGEADFRDNAKISDYAQEAVNVMSANEIIVGDSGSFNPMNETTRAQSVVMLSRVLNLKSSTGNTGNNAVNTKAVEKSERATILMKNLGLKDLISDNEEAVTREQFLVTLMGFLKYNVSAAGASTKFSDVGEDIGALTDMAVEQNFVLPSDKFNPSDPIVCKDALRMALAAMGYGKMISNMNDSDIVGLADRANLLDNIASVSADSKLMPQEALGILYNAVTNDIMQMTSENDYELKKDTTILSENFDIYVIKDVVTAIKRTSLNSPSSGVTDDNIRLGNTTYLATHGEEALLGYKVEAFVRDKDDNEIIAAFPYQTNVYSFEGKESDELKNNKIEFTKESGKKRVTIDTNYDIIYNGKAIDDTLSYELINNSNSVTLLDNDNDNEYEVIFINKASYLRVDGIDAVNNIIKDKSLYKNNLDLGKDDCVYTIYDEEGEEIPYYSITKDSVLEAYVSRDSEYIEIHVLGESVSGLIETTSSADNKISISGIEYDAVPELLGTYSGIAPGTTVEATLDRYGNIAYISFEDSGMRYGYIIKAYQEDGDVEYVKLLCDNGTIINTALSDKVVVDGTSKSKEAAYALISDYISGDLNGSAGKAGLVKYSLNGDDELSNVDLAEVDSRGDLAIGVIEQGTVKEKDSLTMYSLLDGTNTYRYKSYSGLLWPKANISAAKIFVVPKNKDNATDEDYAVVGSSYFENDKTMSKDELQVFDLDSYGSPKALLYYGDSKEVGLGRSASSAIITAMTETVNDEGEECYEIELFVDGKASRYITDSDLDLTNLKSSGNPICPGDMVRVAVNGNEIKKIAVDFDASPDVLAPDSAGGAYINVTWGDSHQYQTGKVYSVSSSGMYITAQPNARIVDNHKFNFALKNLYQCNTTTSIYRVNMSYSEDGDGVAKIKNVTAEPIELQDINSYLNVGENADYAIVRQAHNESRVIYIYHVEGR